MSEQEPWERREALRRSVLQQAASAMNMGGWGVDVSLLQASCRLLGKPPATAEIIAAIEYLVSEKHLVEAPRRMSPKNQLWKVTSTGMNFAEQEGLA